MRYALRLLLGLLLVLGTFGCGNGPGGEQDSGQAALALTEAEVAALDAQRAVVERYLGGSEQNRRNFQTAPGKLGVIRAILEMNDFTAAQTDELHSMGIVLGDALVQELGMEWVMLPGSAGPEPAVRLPGTEIAVQPRPMIAERVLRGERVEAFPLFFSLVRSIEAQVDEAQHR